MVPPVKDIIPFGMQKTISLVHVGLWGPPWKLQISLPIIYLIVAAVTWLKCCRYGIKPKTINQSCKFRPIYIYLHISQRYYYNLDDFSPAKRLYIIDNNKCTCTKGIYILEWELCFIHTLYSYLWIQYSINVMVEGYQAPIKCRRALFWSKFYLLKAYIL